MHYPIQFFCAFLAIANRSAPLRTKRVRLHGSPLGIKGSKYQRDFLKIKVINSKISQ